MFTQKRQRGQSMALIAIAMVGLIGITALAIDSGNAFTQRRRAQSAADDAVLAGSLAKVNSQDATAAVFDITRSSPSNDFPDATVSIHIGAPFTGCDGSTINITHILTSQDPNDDPAYYIQVIIRSSVKTYFGQIVGINQTKFCVQAIARAKPFLVVPAFFGNAVVGLDPADLSYNDHSNATYWDITGGGIFANHDAADDHSNVTFHPTGICATAVNSATGFTCNASQNNPQLFFHYKNATDTQDQISALLPPIPACDGTATLDPDDDKIHPEAGKDGSVWSGGITGDYAPGLFCITDAGGNIHGAITGVGVTFYFLDTDFTMKFNGGGYIGASAPTSGTYKGVLMFSALTPTPCTQNIQIRGNGSTPVVGTIFMPSACIDYRGNGTGDLMDSQLIGYEVTSNGSGIVKINYNAEDNYKYPQPPIIELTK